MIRASQSSQNNIITKFGSVEQLVGSADCKSALLRACRFESYPVHQESWLGNGYIRSSRVNADWYNRSLQVFTQVMLIVKTDVHWTIFCFLSYLHVYGAMVAYGSPKPLMEVRIFLSVQLDLWLRWLEQRTHNAKVSGSNPEWSTSSQLVQRIEHWATDLGIRVRILYWLLILSFGLTAGHLVLIQAVEVRILQG